MKSLFIVLLLTSPSIIYSQSDTTKESKKKIPYYIETCIDKMTDKSYAFGSKSLLCSEDGKKGFIISISWKNKDGEVAYSGVNVKSAGIGSCVENSTLIFLFDDDSKAQVSSWNSFNCEGNSYMDWNGKSYDKFIGKKVKAIRFQNGRTMDSYTYNLTEKEQSYFVEVGKAFSEKRFVVGSCND